MRQYCPEFCAEDDSEQRILFWKHPMKAGLSFMFENMQGSQFESFL